MPALDRGIAAGRNTRGCADAPDLEVLFPKLKPGPGLSAERVDADQRQRLHGATIALIDRFGCDSLRVRAIARCAGVSTATFYKHFANDEECVVSTFDRTTEDLLRHVAAPASIGSNWRENLRSLVSRLFVFLAERPPAASLVLVDIYAAGPNARRQIDGLVGELERLLIACFDSAPRDVVPPRRLIAGMAAGLLRVARGGVLAGRADELAAFSNEATDWLLTLPGPGVVPLFVRKKPDRTRRVGFSGDAFRLEGAEIADDRLRLRQTALRLVSVHGYDSLTVRRLRAEAEVSKRSFESCFGSPQDCLLEAIREIVIQATTRARSRSEDLEDWSRRTGRFIASLCAQATEDRIIGPLAVLGPADGGAAALLDREHLVAIAAAEFRETVPSTQRPSMIFAEASVAAAWRIAQIDVAAGRLGDLAEVSPLIAYCMLAPTASPRTESVQV